MKALFLIGRIVFGGFFLYNGINHFKQKDGLAQYAGAKNVPYPDVAVVAAGAALPFDAYLRR
jgi:putative oxidoreductase